MANEEIELQEVQEVLDGLSAPTDREFVQAVRYFSDTAIASAAAKRGLEGGSAPGGTAGGVLSGTYPNPGFAADMATQAELDAMSAQAVILAPAASSRNVIQPTAGSVIAAIAKAHASQSVDLTQWQKSDGTVYGSVSSTGHWLWAGLDMDPSADSSALRAPMSLTGTLAAAGPTNPAWLVGFNTLKALQYVELTSAITADDTSKYQDAVFAVARITGTKRSAGVDGLRAVGYHDGTKPSGGTKQANSVNGGWFLAHTSAASTGDISTLAGFVSGASHSGAGAATNVLGIQIGTLVENNSGAITNLVGADIGVAAGYATSPKIPNVAGVWVHQTFVAPQLAAQVAGVRIDNQGDTGVDAAYGLLIAAQSGATENYAIYAAGGRVVSVGPIIIGQTSAPADNQYANSQGGWWWDQANSVPKWKGKTSGGTVVSKTPYVDGGTDVPVADGGTGASTAAAARDNLGAPAKVGWTIVPAATGNATTDTAAIVAALTTAGTTGKVMLTQGSEYHVTSDQISIACDFDANDATLFVTDTSGTAVRLATGTSLKTIRLPDIYRDITQSGGQQTWTTTHYGVRVEGVQNCDIYCGWIRGFTDGLRLEGGKVSGAGLNGCGYNNFYHPTIGDCKRSIVLHQGTDHDNAAWVNENDFWGGRCYFFLNEAASGTRYILIDAVTGATYDSPDTNRFWGMSLEGGPPGNSTRPEYEVDCAGHRNTWYNCRWEGDDPEVIYRESQAGDTVGATGNFIHYGFDSAKIAFTYEVDNAGATLNSVKHYEGGDEQYGTAAGGDTYGLRLSNLNGDVAANAHITGLNSSERLIAGATPRWLYRLFGNGLHGKRQGDTVGNNRIELDFQNGAVKTGAGSAAALQVLAQRRTGWTAATGTATRTSFATSTVTTAELAQAVKALIDDLIAHGMIGS